jgi:hypothetical protein
MAAAEPKKVADPALRCCWTVEAGTSDGSIHVCRSFQYTVEDHDYDARHAQSREPNRFHEMRQRAASYFTELNSPSNFQWAKLTYVTFY